MTKQTPHRPHDTHKNPPPTDAGRLRPGTLPARLEAATQRGLATGELLPLATNHQIIESDGFRFHVHVLAQLQRKDAAKAIQIASKETPRPPRNPFLPYEPQLFVADISDTHVAVLNKYNVLPHHTLLITRQFASQMAPLDADDLAAIGQCLQEVDGLGFFNGGELAGASQPHKHLQFILLPMMPTMPDEPDTPFSPWLDALPNHQEIQSIPQWPYHHGIIRLPTDWWRDADAHTTMLLHHYQRLLQHIQRTPTPPPYNWLITRRWMMLVPRRQEFYRTISVNSLGFVGALLVRTTLDRDLLHTDGPLYVLQQVALPHHKNIR